MEPQRGETITDSDLDVDITICIRTALFRGLFSLVGFFAGKFDNCAVDIICQKSFVCSVSALRSHIFATDH